MINLIQPITVQQAYDGITQALPREFRAWRRLRIVKCDETFSLIFFLCETEYMELELRSAEPQGAHEIGGRAQGGGRPHPHGQGVGPLVFIFGEDFFSKMFRGVSGHSENICFLHIKQHHGNSAENNVSPG